VAVRRAFSTDAHTAIDSCADQRSEAPLPPGTYREGRAIIGALMLVIARVVQTPRSVTTPLPPPLFVHCQCYPKKAVGNAIGVTVAVYIVRTTIMNMYGNVTIVQAAEDVPSFCSVRLLAGTNVPLTLPIRLISSPWFVVVRTKARGAHSKARIIDPRQSTDDGTTRRDIIFAKVCKFAKMRQVSRECRLRW
jgi:hypothetical protein